MGSNASVCLGTNWPCFPFNRSPREPVRLSWTWTCRTTTFPTCSLPNSSADSRILCDWISPTTVSCGSTIPTLPPSLIWRSLIWATTGNWRLNPRVARSSGWTALFCFWASEICRWDRCPSFLSRLSSRFPSPAIV
uniref:Uncharacterized protein n=1 Tax=Cacopsylla melanoneura TaxID=428564 RepID=A0A8D8W8Z7_9HEMI